MLTKQIKPNRQYKWIAAGITMILLLAACTGAPGQIQTNNGSPAANQPAAPTQAAANPTQVVPITGTTPESQVTATPAGSISGAPYGEDNPDKVYPTARAAASDDSAELKVSQTAELGSFLVDDAGMTLYLFTKDAPDVTNCSGECLVNWPPLLTEKAPKADDGVDASKLSTITLADGTLQVTYDHMPLYYFIGDKKPGDTVGQNVGGVWFVVPPSGVAAGGDSAELKVSQTADLGSFLVDSAGKSLYIFTKDAPDATNCSGQCLVNWPPFLTVSSPKADDGVDQAKLGTIKLADGTLQVTYDHKPLYYFIGDKNAGDTAGQNVGGVWFVLAP